LRGYYAHDIPVGNEKLLITYEDETICIKFCGVCDVWNKYELMDFYYCIEGVRKE